MRLNNFKVCDKLKICNSVKSKVLSEKMLLLFVKKCSVYTSYKKNNKTFITAYQEFCEHFVEH